METINSFEELVSNPKYQNIFKTYKYDMRKITKILKLEQMGIDISGCSSFENSQSSESSSSVSAVRRQDIQWISIPGELFVIKKTSSTTYENRGL